MAPPQISVAQSSTPTHIYRSIDRTKYCIIWGNSISPIHCSNQTVAWIRISAAWLRGRLGNRPVIKQKVHLTPSYFQRWGGVFFLATNINSFHSISSIHYSNQSVARVRVTESYWICSYSVNRLWVVTILSIITCNAYLPSHFPTKGEGAFCFLLQVGPFHSISPIYCSNQSVAWVSATEV